MHTQPTAVHRKAPRKRQLSRREFLMLLGLGTGGIGTLCGVSSVGAYLLLAESNEQNQQQTPAPTTNPTHEALLKTAQRPPFVSRDAWGARPVNGTAENETGRYSPDNPEGWREYDTDLREAYQTLVVHHSSLYETDDLNTVRAIQNLHMDDRGWADIGYHFLIGQNGSVYEGRRLAVRGTHTEGYNTGSLGLCLLGNLQVDSPTKPQLDAAQSMINWLAVRLRLTHLAGHRDFNDITVCPGDNLYELLGTLAVRAGLALGTEGYLPPADPQAVPEDDATTWKPSPHFSCSHCLG